MMVAWVLLGAVLGCQLPLFVSYVCCAVAPAPWRSRLAAFATIPRLAGDSSRPRRRYLPEFNQTFLNFDGDDKIMIEFDELTSERRWYVPADLISDNATEVALFWNEKRQAEDRLKDAIQRGDVALLDHFNHYKAFLTSEKAEVLQLNHDFFVAWMLGHHHAFSSIWLDSSDAMSLMGGDEHVISGYENVTAYWREMSPAPMRPQLRQAMLHFLGDLAIVTSTVEMVAAPKAAPKATYHCTNVFVKSLLQGRYFLVAHLSSDAAHPSHRTLYKDPTAVPRSRGRARSEEGDDGEEDEGEDDLDEDIRAEADRFARASLLRRVFEDMGITLPPRGAVGTPIVVMGRKDAADSVPPNLAAFLGNQPLPRGSVARDALEAGNGGDTDEPPDGVAAQTVSALQHLYLHGKISKTEKQLLTSDVIQHVNSGSCSKVEVALSVLIAGFRPQDLPEEAVPEDFGAVDAQDWQDFEEMCHRISKELLEA